MLAAWGSFRRVRPFPRAAVAYRETLCDPDPDLLCSPPATSLHSRATLRGRSAGCKRITQGVDCQERCRRLFRRARRAGRWLELSFVQANGSRTPGDMPGVMLSGSPVSDHQNVWVFAVRVLCAIMWKSVGWLARQAYGDGRCRPWQAGLDESDSCPRPKDAIKVVRSVGVER